MLHRLSSILRNHNSSSGWPWLRRSNPQWVTVTVLVLIVVTVFTPGCSVKRLAINKLGDALSGGGTTFASDDDPELIKSAVPFSLKLMESLLQESPRHQGLLLASASGFTQFAFAFVQQEADELEDQDVLLAKTMRDRARKLYLRARDYGFRGLQLEHPNFVVNLRANPSVTLSRCHPKQTAFLYWTAASWAAAIAVSKDDPNLVADLNLVEAMMDRAFALDPSWNEGAIHSFFISYELVRQSGPGSGTDRARSHFEKAVALSSGKSASPYVSYAESVCVQEENRAGFEKALNAALQVDVNAIPGNRLVNTVMQRRARWLLNRIDKLFLPPVPPS